MESPGAQQNPKLPVETSQEYSACSCQLREKRNQFGLEMPNLSPP